MTSFNPSNPANITYGQVEGLWNSKPVAIIGCGTSLNKFDFERLRGIAFVLAVKGAMFDVPWADTGYGIDAPRYMEWQERIGQISMPIYWAASGMHKLKAWSHVTFLKRADGDGWSVDPSYIYSGGTSGRSALNFADLKGATNIALFGFDYRGNEKGRYNDKHYQRQRVQMKRNWQTWARAFEGPAKILAKKGVKVINASPDSHIEVFPKMSLDDAVLWLERA